MLPLLNKEPSLWTILVILHLLLNIVIRNKLLFLHWILKNISEFWIQIKKNHVWYRMFATTIKMIKSGRSSKPTLISWYLILDSSCSAMSKNLCFCSTLQTSSNHKDCFIISSDVFSYVIKVFLKKKKKKKKSSQIFFFIFKISFIIL